MIAKDPEISLYLISSTSNTFHIHVRFIFHTHLGIDKKDQLRIDIGDPCGNSMKFRVQGNQRNLAHSYFRINWFT